MSRPYKKIKSHYGSEPDIEMTDIAPLLQKPKKTPKNPPVPIPHATSYPIITIYIGHQKQKILLPSQTLTKQSQWFNKALKNNCTIFSFTREDPHDMTLFFEYLQKGTYTIPKTDYHPKLDTHNIRLGDTYMKLSSRFAACRFGVHNRHANLYLLGERFEVSQLREYAFTALWNLLAVEDPVVISRHQKYEVFLEERLRLVRRVYRTPRSYTVQLRRLLAFKVSENWGLYMAYMRDNKKKGYKGCLTFDDFMNGAPGFVCDVMAYLGDSQSTLAEVGKHAFLESVHAKYY